MRAMLFARRCGKEILRDPLSYLFSLGLPVALLVVMYLVFYEPQAAFWFSLDMLTPGITVFSYAFTMLFMTLLVSKDRTGAFLTRLRTSPMTTVDFVLGYTLPGLGLGLGQAVLCGLTGVILGLCAGTPLNVGRLALSILCQVPIIVMYVGLGILFGTLFSDKAAPGATSVLISVGGFLSGAWMPVEQFSITAKGFYAVCRALPFYPAVASSRLALGLREDTVAALRFLGFTRPAGELWYGLALCAAYGLAAFLAAVLVFRARLQSDRT